MIPLTRAATLRLINSLTPAELAQFHLRAAELASKAEGQREPARAGVQKALQEIKAQREKRS